MPLLAHEPPGLAMPEATFLKFSSYLSQCTSFFFLSKFIGFPSPTI